MNNISEQENNGSAATEESGSTVPGFHLYIYLMSDEILNAITDFKVEKGEIQHADSELDVINAIYNCLLSETHVLFLEAQNLTQMLTVEGILKSADAWSARREFGFWINELVNTQLFHEYNCTVTVTLDEGMEYNDPALIATTVSIVDNVVPLLTLTDLLEELQVINQYSLHSNDYSKSVEATDMEKDEEFSKLADSLLQFGEPRQMEQSPVDEEKEEDDVAT